MLQCMFQCADYSELESFECFGTLVITRAVAEAPETSDMIEKRSAFTIQQPPATFNIKAHKTYAH